MTVIIKMSSYYYSNSSIRVSTSLDSEELTLDNSMSEYTVVLDCADFDAVTIKSLENYTSVKMVTVYAGNLTQASLKATETGDDTYRLITGITDKSYVVRDLMEGGNFVYKVKAHYIDGTESAWSNREEVYLIENMPPHVVGDVNHDGNVSIADVTALIDYLLDSNNPICTICADVNGDTIISIADVTELIDILLTGN